MSPGGTLTVTEDKSYKETKALLRIQCHTQHTDAERKPHKTRSSKTPRLFLSRCLCPSGLSATTPWAGASLFLLRLPLKCYSLREALWPAYLNWNHLYLLPCHQTTTFHSLHHSPQYLKLSCFFPCAASVFPPAPVCKVTSMRPGTLSVLLKIVSPQLRTIPGTWEASDKYLMNK